ncbi:uncharacterized protein LOC132201030 [Neocloeon triangulifer]|uniref:uncharacterized protein LOC132201030 n=1 Tax=Neocloeon triangulifer TaxID=2078957 RepID=UPI00286F34C8|nr:uncharacterized protein LOC132201030 [Neocloeon triangulifer]
MLPAIVILFLVSFAPLGETKTTAEWITLVAESIKECIKELKLENEFGSTFSFDKVLNMTKPEEFSANLKCLIKCGAEKLNGQVFSKVDAFIEKDIEITQAIMKAENVSLKKIVSYLKESKSCNEELRNSGKSDCETYIIYYLCTKKVYDAVLKMN